MQAAFHAQANPWQGCKMSLRNDLEVEWGVWEGEGGFGFTHTVIQQCLPLLEEVPLSLVSVTQTQLRTKNVKRKIPETNNFHIGCCSKWHGEIT